MSRVTGRQLNDDERQRGYDSRAQDSRGSVTQAVTMVVAAVINGAAMRVEVHRLNSTRR